MKDTTSAREKYASPKQPEKYKIDTPIHLNKREKKILNKLGPLADQISKTINHETTTQPGVQRRKAKSICYAVCEGTDSLEAELQRVSIPTVPSPPVEKLQGDLRDALMVAVYLRDPQKVKMLLKSGIKYQEPEDAYTPAMAAVDTDQLNTIEVFVNEGVRLEGKCTIGSVLHGACRIGNVDILDRLLELEYLDVNEGDSVDGTTPLQTAVIRGHLPMVERLIQAGADVNIRHKGKKFSERTCLHYAALKGHFDILCFLLRHGADRHKADSQGAVPLVTAANFSHQNCFDVLAEGMELDALTSDGETLLFYSCSKGFNKCLELLLEKGADPHVIGKSRFTPLMEAVVNKNESCIKVMSGYPKCCAGINNISSSEEEHTALSLALQHNCHGLLKHLVQMGADVNVRLKKLNKTEPLILIYADDNEIVKFLLENNADPNVMTDDGDNVLSQVMDLESGCVHKELFDLIFKYNFDIRLATMVGRSGLSAMDKATEDMDTYAIRKMLEAGCEITPKMRDWASKVSTQKNLDPEVKDVINFVQNCPRPRSLQELGRLATLRCLPHVNVDKSIDSLYLPHILIDFLKADTFSRLKSYDITQCGNIMV